MVRKNLWIILNTPHVHRHKILLQSLLRACAVETYNESQKQAENSGQGEGEKQ